MMNPTKYLLCLGLGLFVWSGCEETVVRDHQPVRSVTSLNGTWQIEQGGMVSAPTEFTHTIQVPALLNSATPPFADVGVTSPRRDAFWYRTSFTAPAEAPVMLLKIHKVMFGARIWLNGVLLGDHLDSYTTAEYDVAGIVNPDAANELVVRVGETVSSVPATVPAGIDSEKEYFIPGIYDDVVLQTSGTPRIVNIKIEPDLDRNQVRVLTFLHNGRDQEVRARVYNHVIEAVSGQRVSNDQATRVDLAAGESTWTVQTLPMPAARRWSPEDPFLYAVRSNVTVDDTTTDSAETRFGMRSVEWRGGPDGGFFLNGQRYIIRGSNIAVHRFFEDPNLGTLAWDRDWVRKLLRENPKRLHWNTIRFHVGRAPNFWYDIADEVGMLIVDEYQWWNITNVGVVQKWSEDLVVESFESWIRENWNHPSIAWWDASNESFESDEEPFVNSFDVINRVRHLDPTRAWENGGYAKPHRPGDPIEDHPYLFQRMNFSTDVQFEDVLEDLETNDGSMPQGGLLGFATHDSDFSPYLINEYGWLWIDREGEPTTLTRSFYPRILGDNAGPSEHREAYAYLTAGLTEFWRAAQTTAGIQHFLYLGYSRKEGATADNFIDLENLELEPRWVEYAQNAFAPFAVYIDFWRDRFRPNNPEAIAIDVVNDFGTVESGQLRLFAVNPGGELLTEAKPVTITLEPYGKVREFLELQIPDDPRYMVFAEFSPVRDGIGPVYSRRKVGFDHVGVRGSDPPFEF